MEDEIRRLQDSLRQLEKEAVECLADVHDPTLDTVVQDGRTLRQVIHDLSDQYRERIEQLLWTKWGQRIPRSETKRALAELQGARAQFAAYFTDLRGNQLDVASAAAQQASPRDVIRHVLEQERKGLELIRKALGQERP
jgi:hypothetical protein